LTAVPASSLTAPAAVTVSTAEEVAADRRLLMRLKYRAQDLLEEQIVEERVQAKLKQEREMYTDTA